MKIVAYLRISTNMQARSGLGREAQRQAIEAFAREREAQVLAVYIETEWQQRETGTWEGAAPRQGNGSHARYR